MNLITYLLSRFLTEAQLCERAGIDPAHLAELQARGLAPRPSYRVRLALHCESFFGPHAEEELVGWYPGGAPAWLNVIGELESGDAAFDRFAAGYLGRLEQHTWAAQWADALRAPEHLRAEWGHFLTGTYGVCTRQGLPEDVAEKELAIAAIRALTDGEAQLDADATRLLGRAVDLLDAASAPFAPHEVARSSRSRLVDGVRQRYALQAACGPALDVPRMAAGPLRDEFKPDGPVRPWPVRPR